MPRNRSKEKFIELAESRVTKAIKSIRLIGNLSNKSNYIYSQEDAQKIIRELEKEVKAVKAQFESGDSKSEIKFKL